MLEFGGLLVVVGGGDGVPLNVCSSALLHESGKADIPHRHAIGTGNDTPSIVGTHDTRNPDVYCLCLSHVYCLQPRLSAFHEQLERKPMDLRAR